MPTYAVFKTYQALFSYFLGKIEKNKNKKELEMLSVANYKSGRLRLIIPDNVLFSP